MMSTHISYDKESVEVRVENGEKKLVAKLRPQVNLPREGDEILESFTKSQLMELVEGAAFTGGFDYNGRLAELKFSEPISSAQKDWLKKSWKNGVLIGYGWDITDWKWTNVSIEKRYGQNQIILEAEPPLSKEMKDFCIQGGFSSGQLKEILEGIEDGSPVEWYARKEFSPKQMYQIRISFRGPGFSMKDIELFAKPEFSAEQMWEIKDGIFNGLTREQVSVYAKPEFSSNQMNVIKWGFMEEMSMKQVRVFARKELSMKEMMYVHKKLLDGVSVKEAKMLVNELIKEKQPKRKSLQDWIGNMKKQKTKAPEPESADNRSTSNELQEMNKKALHLSDWKDSVEAAKADQKAPGPQERVKAETKER